MAKYVGKRVVPKHCGAWTKNKEYEMLSIVLDEASGESYISRRVVPAGTLLTDEYYWSICSLFSQQIADMGEEFEERQQAITQNNAETLRQIRVDNDATEQAIRQDNDATEQTITQDNSNTRTHVDEVTGNALAAMNQAKQSFDTTSAALTTRMNSIAGQATSDTEILDARVDADGNTHENLGEAIRSIVPGIDEKFDSAQLAHRFFSLTESREVTVAVEGYYIASNHRLVTYSPFSVGESIEVNEGDIVVARFKCNSGVRCIAYYDEETDTYSDSIRGSEEELFVFHATRDGCIRFCYMPEHGCSYRIITSEGLLRTIRRVASLEADNEEFQELRSIVGLQIGEKQTAEIGFSGKYVNLENYMQNYEHCYISTPVPVRRGDFVKARMYINGAVYQIAFCNQAGDGAYKGIVNETGNEIREVSCVIDRDGFICFSSNVEYATTYQICHLEQLRGIFDQLARIESVIASHNDRLDRLDPVANNLSVQRSRNLFDKNAVINGYYVSSAEGTLSRSESSAVSDYIPVEAGKVYSLKRTGGGGHLGSSEISYLAEDKRTRLKPLNADGSSRGTMNYMASQDIVTMAPEGAAYCQFTVNFNGRSANYDYIQFEEGYAPTEYVPYLYRPYVDYEALPTELNGLAEKTETLEHETTEVLSGINHEDITIANSGKIGFFSNSFLNGYTMRTHHALDNLGMWSDYIMYNYGKSGDDALETLARINANQTFFGAVPVQDWGLSYGVIAMQDNDGALFAADRETYRENFKKIAEAIRAMGATPILGTEHDWAENYYGLMALAQEEGYLFMDWGRTANAMGRFTPFWQSGHPATRTHWLWTYGMKPFLDALPRPDKGIKLFRKRPDISAELDALMFNNVYERAERFVEIDNGYACLTKATAKYFDRLNNGLTEHEYLSDEYQKIQSGTASVSFGTHALIDVISPYAAGKLKGLTMHLNAEGVEHAYIKRTLSLSHPLPERRFIAFGVTAGADQLTPGTSFKITGGVFNDSILGTYTVDQMVGNMAVTTTSSSNKTTSGTDAPVCSLGGVTLAGSYDYPSAEYMLRFAKPLGEWDEISLEENGVTDLSSHLKTCMDFDKISILLTGTEITISAISFDVEGTVRKQANGKKMPVRKEGESLLTDTLLDNGTAWENIESVLKYVPVISAVDNTTVEPLPNGISTVRILDEGESITQAYDRTKLAKDAYHPDHIQIRVLARYFPEYINTDEKWANSEVFEGSYDCAQMSVIIDGRTKCARTPVGAFWNEFIFDVLYQNCARINTITVQCDKKSLQIAKVEMELVKE